MSWQQLKVQILSDQFECISESLEAAGALAITLTDAADNPIYEPDPGTTPFWDTAEMTALFEADYDLQPLIKTLQSTWHPLVFRIEILTDQPWERVCMDQFKPLNFQDRLWICPSWHEVEVPNAIVVKLDPGLAFGTGAHPTTRLCLAWLANENLYGKTVIDYGCGSGILGIAALKLGASKVYAVDIDPQALEATKANALRNGLSLENLSVGFPDALPKEIEADILLANILAKPLIGLADTFASLTSHCGKLVLSGILSEQTTLVSSAYESSVQFLSPSIEEDWVRLVGVKRQPV